MALQQLLNQTITHYAKSSFDKYGKEVDSESGTEYRSRFQQVTKSRMLANGDTILIEAVVYLAGEPSININDRIDYGGNKYRVYGKKTGVDGQGNVHNTVLELQKIAV